jgi:hypothetical protein
MNSGDEDKIKREMLRCILRGAFPFFRFNRNGNKSMGLDNDFAVIQLIHLF